MAKSVAVYGIYQHKVDLEEAIASLREEGFRNTDISVLLPRNVGTKDLAHEKHTKAPEGTVAGAGSGAVVGGALGWLAGTGALALPGLGPLIAAGPILGLLTGAGVGGSVGGVAGALVGLGLPEYEAKRYQGRIRSGALLLSVHCDDSDWKDKASDILEQTGAEDVASSSVTGVAKSAKAGRRSAPTPKKSRISRPLSNTARQGRLLVGEVMSEDVATVDIDATLREASEEMRRLNVGLLPVSANKRIAGIITDRDITVRANSEGFDPTQTSVRVAMTTDFVYCFEDQSVEEAADQMEANHLRRLPVFDRNHKLVGMLSVDDLVRRDDQEELATKVLKGSAHRRSRESGKL